MIIPVFIESRRSSRSLWKTLERSALEQGIETIPYRRWPCFLECPETLVAVVARRLRDDGFSGHLQDFVWKRPDASMILVTRMDAMGGCTCTAPGAVDMVFHHELTRFGVVARTARRRADLADLTRDVLRADYTTPAGAVARCLLHRIPPSELLPPRTQESLAVEVGCSARTLRRRAHELNLSLSAAIQHALVARALWVRDVERISWDGVFYSLGYAGLSGLSELSRRVVGHGVRHLDWRAWGPVLTGLRDALCPDP